MDLPTFFIEALKVNGSVLSAWAWPAAIVSCAFIFKREVRGLLHRIKSLKGAGVEAAFEEGLEVLEETPKDLGVALGGGPGGPSDESPNSALPTRQAGDDAVAPQGEATHPKVRDVSNQLPTDASPHDYAYWSDWFKRGQLASMRTDSATGAIVRNWRKVENAIRELYALVASGSIGVETRLHGPVYHLIRMLADQGYIDQELHFRINELRKLRTIAIHGNDDLPQDKADRYEMEALYVVLSLHQILSKLRYEEPQLPLFEGRARMDRS